MRALTRSVSISLLLASPAAAQTYEPVQVEPVIIGTPTAMTPLQLNDDNTAKVDLGFEFTYWGQTFTSAWVSSNGTISFSTSANLCCEGRPLEQAPRNTIFGLWTDLVSYSGNPYYKRGTGSILFGWYGTQEYGTQSQYTFEIGLKSDNSVQFNYGALPQLTYHYAAAGMTGPGSEDNILLFYGRNPGAMAYQSGVLTWSEPEAVDCNVTPMDPSCPPESIAPIDFVSTSPIETIVDAARADAAADAAEAIVASLPEPEQEVTVGELEPSASIPERVAEAVAAERLSPDQVAALAAPGAQPLAQGSDFAASVSTGELPGVNPASAVQFGSVQTNSSTSAAFIGAFETVPSPSGSAASAANTLEVLNTLSAPAPQMAAEQQPTANAMAEGQGEVLAAIASVPGFSAYTQVSLQDRPDFYAIRDIYRNRRLRDANFEMYRLTRTNTDKLQDMIDAQYRR